MSEALSASSVEQLGFLIQQFPVARQRLRSLALVSASREEGTTTCTANLSKFVTETSDSTVLMVDANLHHPALHQLAGVDQRSGLAEILQGTCTLEDAVQETRVRHLSIVTSGASERPTSHLLATSALERGVLQPAEEFDLVVFDCPAVNPYLEAASVAALCDGVILVVQGGVTRREVAQSAKALLERAGCKLLGVFMNRRKYYVPKAIYDRL